MVGMSFDWLVKFKFVIFGAVNFQNFCDALGEEFQYSVKINLFSLDEQSSHSQNRRRKLYDGTAATEKWML